MTTKDVTKEVEFGDESGGCIPLTKCVCGEEFDLWRNILGVHSEHADPCPTCGRKFIFEVSIKVLEVINVSN